MSIYLEDPALNWIRFVRQYGPIASNKSAYEEHIHKSAKRNGVKPIFFPHPYEQKLLESFQTSADEQRSVILTGTAGDGKTHLCHQVWRMLGGDDDDSWGSETYDHRVLPNGVTLHLVKDLTAWSPPTGEKEAFLEAFSASLFTGPGKDCYLIAVNDGQLIESWRRLPDTTAVVKARALFEELLVEDKQSADEVRLWFYNLSRSSSAELLDQALPAFLKHEGWKRCFEGEDGQRPAYGAHSPIRRNYELLSGTLVQKRLRQLFELCDYNELHIPIREILTLLANAVLGHPKCGDALMIPVDVEVNFKSKAEGEEGYNRWVGEASIYNNLLGGNLRSARRETIGVFNYLDRFRIGHETTNRIDNMLIFGDADEELREYFDRYLAEDSFYGAGEAYRSAQKYYIEGADESEEKNTAFLKMLIAQRRGLFFKIPDTEAEELHLWDLTVFRYAGEYLTKVIQVLNPKSKVVPARVEKEILGRLVKGLNRVFVGMLVTSEHELYLGTSLRSTSAKVSRILEESISVTPKLGERVEVIWHRNGPALRVALSGSISRVFALNLVRYEFLSRVATGALPSSFSKECYEDVLSFKSQVLSALDERRALDGEEDTSVLTFRPLVLDDNGVPKMGEIIEVSALTEALVKQ